MMMMLMLVLMLILLILPLLLLLLLLLLLAWRCIAPRWTRPAAPSHRHRAAVPPPPSFALWGMPRS